MLTDDQYARAINADGTLKSADNRHAVGVTVQEGAAIGARGVCIAPGTLGRWALVAAGSVVTRDVPDFAIVIGNPVMQRGAPAGRVYRCNQWARLYGMPEIW